ncbi:MAG: redox-sensing transcriptional repressor Rex [Candidatus Pacebacteria bacterium]|nr:redox-sensing transcriptional repressor Rex [Candidatus Paceibacterota bacterium]
MNNSQKHTAVSSKTVGRLSRYRRLLRQCREQEDCLFSHRLAELAGVTPAQVRRDIMAVGYSGSPSKGYEIKTLLQHIDNFLDPPIRQPVALVGVGNLGRAILAFFAGRRPKLKIVAAFDKDPHKADRVIVGCRCYPVEQLADIMQNHGITIGIIAVPASAAQETAAALVASGATGILNFAPTPLRVPATVYVEDIDLTTSLDTVAYFARSTREPSLERST